MTIPRKGHRIMEMLHTLERVGPCTARELHRHIPGVAKPVTVYGYLTRAAGHGVVKHTFCGRVRVYSVMHGWQDILAKKKQVPAPVVSHHLDGVWKPIKRN